MWTMRSVVDLNIQAPRDPVAALFADPMNSPKWMDDIDRCEPISGTPGFAEDRARNGSIL